MRKLASQQRQELSRSGLLLTGLTLCAARVSSEFLQAWESLPPMQEDSVCSLL